MTMAVNKERMELWAAALESEGYVQCRGTLRQILPGNRHIRHCALGVAMEVARLNGCYISWNAWMYDSTLPWGVAHWYGLTERNPVIGDPIEGNNLFQYPDKSFHIPLSAVLANDQLGLSFWEIAQMIRAKYLKDDHE